MKPGRYHCVTQKLSTAHGSVFIHVDLYPCGAARSVAVSQPQKFEDTAIGKRLESVVWAMNADLDETPSPEMSA